MHAQAVHISSRRPTDFPVPAVISPVVEAASPSAAPALRTAPVEIRREHAPDFERSLELLRRAFPRGYPYGPDYLEWLYMRSCGRPSLVVGAWSGSDKIGQMVFLPHDVGCAGRTALLGFTADFFVVPEARSGPLLIRLTREALKLAQEHGFDGIYGLPNNASLPVVSRFLKAKEAAQLNVRVGLARSSGRSPDAVESTSIAGLDHPGAWSRLAPYLSSAGRERQWSETKLDFRLRSPCRSFAMHASDEAALISCRHTMRGRNVTLLCAILPRDRNAPGERQLVSRHAVNRLVRAACRFHRNPVFCYVGLNRHLEALPGLALPRMLYPSPFKLVTRMLTPELSFEPDRYELIDTDVI